MIELSKSDKAMIRAAAGDLDTAGVQNLEARVAARLTELVDSGVVSVITRNHIRAAITASFSEGR
ncbi:hypothetical protein HU675_0037355 [Bradyrhizobium septentrionale]|uniref:hypothetical protein n=1 Tax=Bradyrhizobium septentrionale TaxID=1404411 RepID=UPI00159663DB|nr:hypothetical protein [Bradyrhizobium septentrionale]UGY23566.1 hypothetical protein HU675_0037355 [Bradyrhizobium septentrionale]